MNCNGIAILGAGAVPDEAMRVADQTMEFMLSRVPDVKAEMNRVGAFHILRGTGVSIPMLPGALFPTAVEDTVAAWNFAVHATTSRSDDILCRFNDTLFYGSNLFVEVFSRQILGDGIPINSPLDVDLQDAYAEADNAGLWNMTVAGFDPVNYFGELSTIWFEVHRPEGPAGGNGIANDINTRAELLNYDNGGYQVLNSIYPLSFDVPGCVRRGVVTPYLDETIDCPPELADIDGTVYPLTQIGQQCWMAKNLQTSSFSNQTPVLLIDDANWPTTTAPGRAIYDNNGANVGTFGQLYNHAAAVDTRGLCPAGMHVPTAAEVELLLFFLGWASDLDVAPLLRDDDGSWGGVAALDGFGFAALPTGRRDASGMFVFSGTLFQFWVDEPPITGQPDNATSFSIIDNSADLLQLSVDRNTGLSVRCVGD